LLPRVEASWSAGGGRAAPDLLERARRGLGALGQQDLYPVAVDPDDLDSSFGGVGGVSELMRKEAEGEVEPVRRFGRSDGAQEAFGGLRLILGEGDHPSRPSPAHLAVPETVDRQHDTCRQQRGSGDSGRDGELVIAGLSRSVDTFVSTDDGVDAGLLGATVGEGSGLAPDVVVGIDGSGARGGPRGWAQFPAVATQRGRDRAGEE